MNEIIISEFKKLIEQIKHDINNAIIKKDEIRHSFRLRQSTRVLKILEKYPKEIKSGEQLKDIEGVGKGTISRINEILKTGKLSEIKVSNKYKKNIQIIEELEKIFGIGRKTAYDLITKHNIKSIDELKKAYKNKKIELNEQIKLGLKYHGVYQQSIPRSEIDQINELIQSNIIKVDKDLHAQICGSYRRKKDISNDIDILIYHPKIITKKQLSSNENYLIKFVSRLKKINFILDDLTYENYETKYMGYCKFNDNPVRRIDIYYTPYESYYSFLLHLTGSGEFNRKTRSLAIELGYKLNEYGLFNMSEGKEEKIIVHSEKDIFENLGLEYLPPEKR
jgi:DNA polymerase beta